MSYDPYFKANVCRQSGNTEAVAVDEITSKKITGTKIEVAKKNIFSQIGGNLCSGL